MLSVAAPRLLRPSQLKRWGVFCSLTRPLWDKNASCKVLPRGFWHLGHKGCLEIMEQERAPFNYGEWYAGSHLGHRLRGPGKGKEEACGKSPNFFCLFVFCYLQLYKPDFPIWKPHRTRHSSTKSNRRSSPSTGCEPGAAPPELEQLQWSEASWEAWESPAGTGSWVPAPCIPAELQHPPGPSRAREPTTCQTTRSASAAQLRSNQLRFLPLCY